MYVLIKRSTTLLVVTTLCLSLAGCSHWSKRDRNTAIGAGVGAIGGSVLTNGDGLGTIGGAALGGLIGHQTRR